MKNLILIVALSLPLFLAACSKTSNNSNVAQVCASGDKAFIGCWKTTDCIQAKNGGGGVIDDTWFLSQYEFTPQNSLNIATYIYRDSSCSGAGQRVPHSSTLPLITYTWTQAITTSGGLPGDEIALVDINPATASTLNTTVDLVVTSSGQLCTSDSLILGSGYITVSPTNTAIDYNHCLDPVTP